VVDGHLVRGRCRFFDFVSDFWLQPSFSCCGAVMSVSLVDLFFSLPWPSSCCSMLPSMVWTIGPQCQPLV
jgi:hypothetical protein